MPGVKESLLKLKKLNFVCLLVTNQPDVSRGKIKKSVEIHKNIFLISEIKLDDIFVCYHDDCDNCECRKPKPGILIKAIQYFKINPKESWMIGDSNSDLESGRLVGCNVMKINNHVNLEKAVEIIIESN